MSVQFVTPAAAVCDSTFCLLTAGIPLTLLLDLASGPHSAQLYVEERSDVAWVPTQRAG